MTAHAMLQAQEDQRPAVLSGADLSAMPDIGPAELVQGKLKAMSPTGYPHGVIENNLGRILGNFVHQHQLGRTLTGEVGIYTGRSPDTVRGADVVYISKQRLARASSQGYLDVAPELIVEVLSPGDRWTDVVQKLREYFAIGVQSVWLADPMSQELFVYHSLTDLERFTTDDTVSDETVLPGFAASVAEIFELEFEE